MSVAYHQIHTPLLGSYVNLGAASHGDGHSIRCVELIRDIELRLLVQTSVVKQKFKMHLQHAADSLFYGVKQHRELVSDVVTAGSLIFVLQYAD